MKPRILADHKKVGKAMIPPILSIEQQKNLVQMSNFKIKRHTPWGKFKKKLHNVVSYG